MNVRKQFDLDIFKLNDKIHHYEFDIDEKFFESFEDSLLNKGKLKVNLSLNKSSTMIIADFCIKGSVQLVCDRSLEEFDFILDQKEQIIFKFGEEYEEVSEEIVIIPQNTQKLDVAQFIYEFIGLSMPMKKLHPRFQDEETDENEEETQLIYSTGGEEDLDEEGDENGKVEEDIWHKLKNLKNNYN